MNEKLDCKIVQDLLPNYIEKLTNNETNKFVDKHLKECKECNKIYEKMVSKIEIDTKNDSKKDVKYIKRYKSKMNMLKTIILIIFLLFVFVTARKIIIIVSLSNKAENSIITTDNYHRIVYSYDKDCYTKTDYYSLGDKKRIIQTKLTESGKTVWEVISKDKVINKYGAEAYIVDIYNENNGHKTVKKDMELGISADPQNPFYTENFIMLLISSIKCSVKKTTFEGEKCYLISNFGDVGYTANGAYISNDTGLLISTIATEYEEGDYNKKGRIPASYYSYEFNTVTEQDFIKSNINEYK